MRGHVVRNVSLNPRRSVDHTTIQQMPVDKSLPEGGQPVLETTFEYNASSHCWVGPNNGPRICAKGCTVEKEDKHGSLSGCLPEHMGL